MIASALALIVAIGVALVAGDALGDWIGRRIFEVDKARVEK